MIFLWGKNRKKNFLHCRLHPIRLLKLLIEILCILLFDGSQSITNERTGCYPKCVFEGKTVAETANEMDVSTAYVYRLEKRGIHRLRGMLSKLMHERK